MIVYWWVWFPAQLQCFFANYLKKQASCSGIKTTGYIYWNLNRNVCGIIKVYLKITTLLTFITKIVNKCTKQDTVGICRLLNRTPNYRSLSQNSLSLPWFTIVFYTLYHHIIHHLSSANLHINTLQLSASKYITTPFLTFFAKITPNIKL